jgi:hypothetical protein
VHIQLTGEKASLETVRQMLINLHLPNMHIVIKPSRRGIRDEYLAYGTVAVKHDEVV